MKQLKYGSVCSVHHNIIVTNNETRSMARLQLVDNMEEPSVHSFCISQTNTE